jgi:hypothetical protein
MQLFYLYHVIFAGIFFVMIWVKENHDNYAITFIAIIVNLFESVMIKIIALKPLT